ncbi:MAG: glycosyltransferase family 39 protein [Flavobacteriaceae bacterium]
MGQSWVNGHLPYTELWDLKPPLVFLFFASIIYVFGKSFIAIRLIGALVIASTSFIVYKIGIKIHSKKAGLWMGLLYIYTSSLFGDVQGVMSEHLSMFFFLFGFYFILRKRGLQNILWAGLLFGCALLMKLNLSYAFLFISISYFYLLLQELSFKKSFYYISALGISTGIPFILICLPYHLQGLDKLYFDSVFLASLAYCNTPFQEKYNIIIPVLFILPFVLGFLKWRKKITIISNYSLLLILSAIIGILNSFLMIGKINGHYLLQLYPFLVMLLIPFLVSVIKPRNKILSLGLLILFALLPLESYKEYLFLGNRLLNNQSLYNGEGIEIPAYLKSSIKVTDKVFFLDFHIGYWELDRSPLTKAVTHPSNIKRENLYPFYGNTRKNCLEELTYILETVQPKIIVTKNGEIPFLYDNPTNNNYFIDYLKKHYKLTKTIGKGEIYKLNGSSE